VPGTTPPAISQLLAKWREGDHEALRALVPLVYDDLRRVAHLHLRKARPDHTLQTTALVHEAYLKLVDVSAADLRDRAHFFAVCAQIMRRILVDWARSHRSLKRGGNLRPVQLEEALVVSPESEVDLVGLDDALEALAAIDPRKSRIMELRFFGGLSVEETAAVLKVSPETVLRDSRLAKSWLWRELTSRQVP